VAKEKISEALAAVLAGVKAAAQTVKAVAPGLSPSKIANDIGKEVKGMVAHGAHEMAAALFNNSAFVMYPRGGKEDPKPEVQKPEVQKEGQQQERGGRGGM
jgi:hypothetical protein